MAPFERADFFCLLKGEENAVGKCDDALWAAGDESCLNKGADAVGRNQPGKSVDKWKVYRDICDARSLLGLRDRALSVLNALLSFYPEICLAEGSNLVVFPSNAQLATRANGIAGTTLRENLAVLVDAG